MAGKSHQISRAAVGVVRFEWLARASEEGALELARREPEVWTDDGVASCVTGRSELRGERRTDRRRRAGLHGQSLRPVSPERRLAGPFAQPDPPLRGTPRGASDVHAVPLD